MGYMPNRDTRLSQDELNILLNTEFHITRKSKYNDTKFIGFTTPGGLTILKFITTGCIDGLKAPHYICRCSCGNLCLVKCNHALDGLVNTCGACVKSKSQFGFVFPEGHV